MRRKNPQIFNKECVYYNGGCRKAQIWFNRMFPDTMPTLTEAAQVFVDSGHYAWAAWYLQYLNEWLSAPNGMGIAKSEITAIVHRHVKRYLKLYPKCAWAERVIEGMKELTWMDWSIIRYMNQAGTYIPLIKALENRAVKEWRVQR